MKENNNNNLMRATTEWMSKWYNKFNQELFGGELGDCRFEIFLTGKGSQGRTLGRFKLENSNVRAMYYDRHMYVQDYYSEDIRYINKNNFADIAQPCIMLNGHYSGTEESLLNTLVHEMCHYYDYLYGYCPKQAHGPSFRNIALMVSSRSGGRFTIERLATAEVMSGYQLDADMQEKIDKRKSNKKARTKAIFVVKKDGRIEMTLTSNNNVDILNKIIKYYAEGDSKQVKEILTSTDPNLIDMLYNKGYRKLMRTWRYWEIGHRDWSKEIYNYNLDTVINNNRTKTVDESRVREIVESVIDKFNSSLDNNDSVQVGGIDLELRSPMEGA